MADTTITITIPEAQWATLQSAYATADADGSNAVPATASSIKNILLNDLKMKVKKYDEGRQSVTYSTFSPS